MGRLVLVATPIGNLGDLPPRAVAELAGADAIVCEDTRRTRTLLAHAGVKGPRRLVANEHTEAATADHVGELLAGGATVAVVTDAGTPGISDPGERLVRAAIAGGHDVTMVPGPSAALAALVTSGQSTSRFAVEGFLPRRGPERRQRIDEVARDPRTVVLFEAPHRLARTLTDLVAACGRERPVTLARELTKLHEEVWRGSLAAAVARVEEQEPRGEHVIVLGGAPPPTPATAADVEAALAARRAAGVDRKTAVSEVARELGVAKRAVYDASLRLYPAR
jgi:16S rRNA (cytidine1402-2'-O)-methyltransferase